MEDKDASPGKVGRLGCLSLVIGAALGFVAFGLVGSNMTSYERGESYSDSVESAANLMIIGALVLVSIGILALIVSAIWSMRGGKRG